MVRGWMLSSAGQLRAQGGETTAPRHAALTCPSALLRLMIPPFRVLRRLNKIDLTVSRSPCSHAASKAANAPAITRRGGAQQSPTARRAAWCCCGCPCHGTRSAVWTARRKRGGGLEGIEDEASHFQFSRKGRDRHGAECSAEAPNCLFPTLLSALRSCAWITYLHLPIWSPPAEWLCVVLCLAPQPAACFT